MSSLRGGAKQWYMQPTVRWCNDQHDAARRTKPTSGEVADSHHRRVDEEAEIVGSQVATREAPSNKQAAQRPPRGFRRVEMGDMDHLGCYTRSRGEWKEYWHPEMPTRLRQEKLVGVAGRVIRVIDLDLRPRGSKST